MKLKQKYSGFERCKKHAKRLKWSDFTDKLNWYMKLCTKQIFYLLRLLSTVSTVAAVYIKKQENKKE